MKTTGKRVLSLLLCMAILAGALPPAAYAAAPSELVGTEGAAPGEGEALYQDKEEPAEVSCPVCGGAHEESACDAAAAPDGEAEGEPADTTLDEQPAPDAVTLDVLAEPVAYDITWYQTEEGTTEFVLSDAADLAGLAAIVNGQAAGVSADSFSGKTVTLAGGIDLSAYLNDESWTPIGTASNPFKGAFDGSGYAVSGLRIGTESAPVTTQYQGLFGALTGARISNLTVEGSIYVAAHYVGGVAANASGGTVFTQVTNRVNVTNSGNTYSAGQYTGGLVGRVASGSGNRFVDCANSGAVSAAYSYAGGLIGGVSAETAVTGCTNSGAVSGTGSYVGGLIGDANSGMTIQNCSNTAQITGTSTYTGGLIGRIYDAVSMTDSFNAGMVSGAGSYVGGLIGRLYDSSAKVERCYNSAAVNCGAGSNYVGGLVGQLSQGTVQNGYSVGVLTPAEGSSIANLGALVGSMGSSGKLSSAFYYQKDAPMRPLGNVAGTISNVFFLKSAEYSAGTGGMALSAEAFQYGEATYLLNGGAAHETVWENGEAHPALGDAETAALYEVSVRPRNPATQATVTVTAPQEYVVSGSASAGYKAYVPAGTEIALSFGSADTMFAATPDGALSGEGLDYTAVVSTDIHVAYALESEQALPDISWYSPTGVSFSITTEQGLRGLALLLRGGTDFGKVDFAGQTVALGADIALTSAWTPLGDAEVPFAGTLDGAGYTVSGLQIGTADAPATGGYQGFFAYNAGTVKNLKVQGSIYAVGDYIGGIVAYNTGTLLGLTFGAAPAEEGGAAVGAVSGGSYVGGVVGYSTAALGSSSTGDYINHASVTASGDYAGGVLGGTEGNLYKAKNYGAVSGRGYVGGVLGGMAGTSSRSVNRSENFGAVTASGDNVGGVAGAVSSSVSACGNSAAVTAAGSQVGGVVGTAGSVSDGKNTGAVSGKDYVGGVAGRSGGYAGSCENAGAVTAAGDYAGGIIGYAETNVQGSSNTGAVTGGSYVGGVAGYAATYLKTSVNNGETVTASGSYVGGLAGYVGSYLTGEAGKTTFDGTVIGRDYVGGIAGYAGGYVQQVSVGTAAKVLAADPVDTSALTGMAAGLVAKLEGGDLNESYCLGTVAGQKAGLLAGEVSEACVVSNAFHYNAEQQTAPLIFQNAGQAANIYYLAAEEGESGGRTAAQFASGEVAWLLDGGDHTNAKTYFTQEVGAAYPVLGSAPVYRVRVATGPAAGGCRLVLNGGTYAAAFSGDTTGETPEKHRQWAYVRSGASLTFGLELMTGWEMSFTPALQYAAVPLEEGQPAPAIPQYTTTVSANYDGDYTFTQVVPPSYTWYLEAAEDPESGAKLYNIATENDLLGLSNLVAGLDLETSGAEGAVSFAGETVNLTADLSMVIGNWRAIGAADTPFEGTFSGGGHAIRAMKLSSLAPQVGLFGYTRNAAVKDLRLQTQVVSAGSFVGGVIGEASGSLRMEAVTLLENSTVQGKQSVGGLVGKLSMTAAQQESAFIGCKSHGSVTAADSASGFAGGIAGLVTTSATKLEVSLKLENCMNGGTVTAASQYAGGLLGMSGAASSQTNYYITAALTGCGNEGAVSAAKYAGGLSGYLASSTNNRTTLTDCANEGAVRTSGDYAGGLLAYGNQYLTLEECANRGAVIGGGQYTGGLVGSLNSYGALTDCHNEAEVSGSKSYVGGLIGQAGSGIAVTGCYNGESAAVSGGASYTGGLFGSVTAASLRDSRNEGTVEGVQYTGGIAGQLNGSSNAKVESVYNTGEVSGVSKVGGIAGQQGSILVQTCWNEGPVTATGSDVGGISGYVSASGYQIVACYNTGAIRSSGSAANVGGITGCNYFTGGGDWGIIGGSAKTEGGVNGCYNAGTISADRGNPGQITGAYPSLNRNCYAAKAGLDSAYCGVLTEKQFASGEAAWLLDGGASGSRLLAWTKGESKPAFADRESGPIYKVAVQASGGGSIGGMTKDGGMFGAAGEEISLVISPSAGQKLLRLVVSLSEEDYTLNADKTELMFAMPNFDVSVTAVFAGSEVSENSCVVTFDANGGAFADGSRTVTQILERDSIISVPEDPVRDKYGFDGWFTDISGSEAADTGAPVTADAAFYAKWNYEGASFAEGAGTQEEPFIISSADDMYLLAEVAGSAAYENKYYKVGVQDLTLGTDWNGIGTDSGPFSGSFDGNGATIHLTAGRGLFGTIGIAGSDVHIGNLTLEASISSGSTLMGGIVGFHQNGDLYFKDITVNGSISGGQATGGLLGGTNGNNYASGGSGSYGADTVTITNCTNNADVRSNGNYVGGLAGNMYATFQIEGCKNTGAISGLEYTGGLLGWLNTGKIVKSGNTGEVEGTTSVGGLLGGISFYSSSERHVISCYNTGNVTGTDTVAGILGGGITTGGNTAYKIENCYNSGAIAYKSGKAGSAMTDEAGITMSHCWALTGTLSAKDKNVTALTADQLASGEAAYLLDLSDAGRRGLWTQDTTAGHPVIGTPAYYPVTVSGTNGTVSIGGRTSGIYLGAGNTARVTPRPDEYTENKEYGPQYGYVLTSLTVNGVDSGTDSFVMPEGAASVLVAFELQQTGYNSRPSEDKDETEPETPIVPGEGTGEGSGTGKGGTGTGEGEHTGAGEGAGTTENTGAGETGRPSGQPAQNDTVQPAAPSGETEQTEPAEPVITEPLETPEAEPEEEQPETPDAPEEPKEDDNLLEEAPEITETKDRNSWPVILLIVAVAVAAVVSLVVLVRKKNRDHTSV